MLSIESDVYLSDIIYALNNRTWKKYSKD